MALTVPKGLLDGHVAVVTGGGSGIGRGTALAMAEAGARIAVVDRNEEGANETASLIGNAASAYRTDVTDAGACRALAGQVAADFGPASILFNNAGIVRRAKIDSPTAPVPRGRCRRRRRRLLRAPPPPRRRWPGAASSDRCGLVTRDPRTPRTSPWTNAPARPPPALAAG